MPFVNRAKLTLSVDKATTKRMDFIKKALLFRSRGEALDHVAKLFCVSLLSYMSLASPELDVKKLAEDLDLSLDSVKTTKVDYEFLEQLKKSRKGGKEKCQGS